MFFALQYPIFVSSAADCWQNFESKTTYYIARKNGKQRPNRSYFWNYLRREIPCASLKSTYVAGSMSQNESFEPKAIQDRRSACLYL